MDGCPSREVLTKVLSDELEPKTQETLEQHIGECGECQRALLHLAGDTELEHWCRVHAREPALPAHEPSETFLRRVKDALAVQETPVSAAEPAPWPSIPGYEILEEIGRGGVAVVYKARQQSLNRLVAVKVLRHDPTQEDRRRALRTRNLIADLRHANIIQFHDLLEFAGRYALILEYLEGGSLNKQVHGKPWPPRRAAELLRTLAQTVQAIHAHGTVHRDLKPSNILLTAEGEPKIADFGLARPIVGGERITTPGDIVGSARYMAAEQAAGKAVGPGVDIYALGTILYELLTGRPPFRGATPLDTLEQVVHEEPEAPSQLEPGVPRDLEAICLRCLRKEAGRRYPSAQELADDLSRFLNGEVVRARRVSIWERGWKWVRRRPDLAVLVAALVPVLIIFPAVRSYHSQQTEKVLNTAEAELYAARLELARQALAAHDPAAAKAVLARCQPQPGRPDRRGPEWHELWRRCHEPQE